MTNPITRQNTLKTTKLVRVYVTFDPQSYVIQDVKITGDFFVHPEDSIDTLEGKLVGKVLDKSQIENTVSECLKDCEIIGFTTKELTNTITGCLKSGQV